MKILLTCLSILCIVTTLMPLIAAKQWWIRVFDFPVLQTAVVTLLTFIGWYFVLDPASTVDLGLLLLLGAALIWQGRIILPYTPFYRKSVMDAAARHPEDRLRVLVANIYQDNRDVDTFLRVFRRADPDVAVLLEIDNRWNRELQALHADYPHRVEHPLENYYGMLLLSRFPLKGTGIKFLIDDNIPSIHSQVKLNNGTWVKLCCLHPMPPSPTENDKSLDRDAELLMVAKTISEKDFPVIVLGDLNDVAWSHTTRLFQRISRLLDPRVGRSFFNTFHAHYPLLRWPLDHMFLSPDFTVGELTLLEPFGSDHFGVFAELYHQPHVENEEPDEASADDHQEASETIQEGLAENAD